MTASQGVSQDLPTRTVDVICPALADFSQEAAIAVLAILGARPGRDSRIGKPGPEPTAQGSLRGHRRAARCFSGRAAALLSQGLVPIAACEHIGKVRGCGPHAKL